MPVLIITPDMTAETCDGATGWARGSQTWNGIAPGLGREADEDQDQDDVAAERREAGRGRTPGREVEAATAAGREHGEGHEQGRRRDVGHGQVEVAGRDDCPAGPQADDQQGRRAGPSTPRRAGTQKALLAPRTSTMLARKSG